MDAFSVSLANGLADPRMSRRRSAVIAGVFAGFQFLMPLTGWLCVRLIVGVFSAITRYIPWTACILLSFIGGRMLFAGIRGEEADGSRHLTAPQLLAQGIATSLDALSVGFTIASYRAAAAVSASVLIGAVTFFICLCGLHLGRRFGSRLSGKAQILGGVILIAIGVEMLF